jgi:outer membrane protein assembly factor BamA
MRPNSLSFILNAGVFICLILCLSACSTSKKLAQNETNLKDVIVTIDGKKSTDEEVFSYIKQKPKKKLFGLRRGIEPYSVLLTEQTKKQLHYYFKNKSFFNNKVTTEIKTKKRKTKVYYNITKGTNFPVTNISYKGITDTTILNLIKELPYQNALKIGENYDYWKLSEERNHIENLLLNKGYFAFKKDFVSFKVDTLTKPGELAIIYEIKESKNKSQTSYTELTKVHTYNNIIIQLIKDADDFDTLHLPEFTIIQPSDYKFPINNKILQSTLLFKKGDIYNKSNINFTYSKLNDLNTFDQIRMNIEKADSNSVNVIIELKEKKRFSTTYGSDIIHISNDLGFSGKIGLERRNIFHGGETFNFNIYGSVQGDFSGAGDDQSRLNFFNTFTYGAQSNLKIPKFLSPFNMSKYFSPFSNVNTNISLSYNRYKTILLGKTEVNSSYGYQWKHNKHVRFAVKPLQINFIRMDENSDLSGFSGSEIQQNLSNYFVTASSFGFAYSNQDSKKFTNHDILLGTIEFSGNILSGLASLNPNFPQTNEGNYTIVGNQFSQYVKLDLDYRHFFVFNKNNSIGIRFLSGFGLPYGNSDILPYNKQYSIGGSNDIRAFPSLQSEPGEYADNDSLNYSADIKLELNLEYRFPIVGSFKGAFFVDAGNIWDIKESVNNKGEALRPEATFKFDNFYNQLYLGTGIGLRFDMDIAVFRIDFGYPIYDPSLGTKNPNYNANDPLSRPYISLPRSERWVINKPLDFSKIQYNFGIGYPF